MGILYVVATPIGNLEDITFRAVRVLTESPLIAAEDTRRALKLLNHFNIRTPVTSYFEHSSDAKRRQILDALDVGDVALISEAGMPGLSDPGYDLIREAIERGVRVVPVPGASALVCALVASGLPTDSFIYQGFLPRRKAERRRALEEVRGETRTLIFYEAPHRVLESLRDMMDTFGDRRAAAARELTKVHEEIVREPLSGLVARYEVEAPRGEFTIVVEGATASGTEKPVYDDAQILDIAHRLMDQGLSARDAAAEASRVSGRPRRQVYELLHRD